MFIERTHNFIKPEIPEEEMCPLESNDRPRIRKAVTSDYSSLFFLRRLTIVPLGLWHRKKKEKPCDPKELDKVF